MHAPHAARGLAAAALLLSLAELPECRAQHTAPAPAFGRLFHTPAQRLELERQRDQPPPAAPPVLAAAPPLPARLIDGILRRSDGPPLVWLDGEAHSLPPGLRLAPGPTLMLIPAAAPQLRLQVGDRWQDATPPSGAR